MSTHFHPRLQPPPTPTSSVRPSTAHSTIRPVTPSPPGSGHKKFRPTLPLPRPKSEYALDSSEMATYAQYVLQAESGGFGTSPDAVGDGMGLRRGNATSGRSSPVKARSNSPRKRPFSTPLGLSAFAEAPAKVEEPTEQEPVVEKQEQPMYTAEEEQQQHNVYQEEQDVSTEPCPIIKEEPQASDSDSSASAPDTPTPMTRAQKRQAYTPLRLPITTTIKDELSFLPPSPPALTPTPGPKFSSTPSEISRKPLNTAFSATNRISVSGTSHATFRSTASKNSVFSTPGRDELERKKALVEIDEGPFARVQSMMDLDEERRKISGAKIVKNAKGGEKRKGKFGECGCVVM